MPEKEKEQKSGKQKGVLKKKWKKTAERKKGGGGVRRKRGMGRQTVRGSERKMGGGTEKNNYFTVPPYLIPGIKYSVAADIYIHGGSE